MFRTSLLLLVSLTALFPRSIFARVTPADLVNSQKADYNQKVSNYSLEDKRKLDKLSSEIAQINKTRTSQLWSIMYTQAAILDEYQKRIGGKTNDSIDKARYWITFAEEAVSYQEAKIYIYSLTSEKNIKADALNLISLFQSDLEGARSKVINSQNILKQTIK